MAIIDTTGHNYEVSNQWVAEKDGDSVSIELSGVGPFAAVLRRDHEGRFHWITQASGGSTPLAILVATEVKRAGFQLLPRDVVTRTVTMNLADGTTETMLYQVLFTDTDVIP